MTDLKNTSNFGIDLKTVLLNIEVLKDLCINNADFYATDSSENGQRLYLSFLAMKDYVENINPKLSRIYGKVDKFDFDKDTPGNGYRSFLYLFDTAVKMCMQINKNVCVKRHSSFFRKASVTKDVEACSQLISSLDIIMSHLEVMLSNSEEGNLFPTQDPSPQELITNYSDINQYCFYGRCLGFQYCEALKNVLQFISISMAVFSEVYYGQGSFISKATNSVFATSKFISDPEQRARRIVNISQNAGVDFCKAFWFLSENDLFSNLPNVVAPSVSVCKTFTIKPEPIKLEIDGKEIEIPVPTSHLGEKPLQVRLISFDVHEGMIGETNPKTVKEPSKGLLFHCHGGGFVAQSSLSHESYLREWARQLKVPILSVDYSLAPEAPFPRAVEETTYAYGWVLKNYKQLGTTGERIVFAGDSAGANIVLSTTLNCIHKGIPLPAGVFVAYAPTIINFIPSPSRLLCMLDTLLPFGFMLRCLKAYAYPFESNNQPPNDHNSDTESFEEISESDLLELQAHKSPVSETSDTLTYGSFHSNNGEDNNGDMTMEDLENDDQSILEKYVLDSDTDTDGTRIPVLRKEQESASSQSLDESIQNRVSNYLMTLKWRFGNWITKRRSPFDFMYAQLAPHSVKDIEKPVDLIEEFRMEIPNDPLMSPYLMSDQDMKKFPPVSILAVHMDPFLDDCIMFAKRLKNAGNNVDLQILPGLPHGFLNFATVTKEAFEGCKICVQKINNLLNLDSLPPQ